MFDTLKVVALGRSRRDLSIDIHTCSFQSAGSCLSIKSCVEKSPHQGCYTPYVKYGTAPTWNLLFLCTDNATVRNRQLHTRCVCGNVDPRSLQLVHQTLQSKGRRIARKLKNKIQQCRDANWTQLFVRFRAWKPDHKWTCERPRWQRINKPGITAIHERLSYGPHSCTNALCCDSTALDRSSKVDGFESAGMF